MGRPDVIEVLDEIADEVPIGQREKRDDLWRLRGGGS